MASRFERDLTMMVASTVQVKQFNKGDAMPFQYVHPQVNGLVWTCGKDEEGRITSVFHFKGDENEPEGKKIAYITEEQALMYKQTLVNDGWVPTKIPDIVIHYPGMEPINVGDGVKLNRRQKRNFAKTMNRLTAQGKHK